MTAAPTTAMPGQAQPRGWLATLVVLLIMLGIVVGGCAAAAAVSSLPDKPIQIGGVTVVVPPEWEYSGRLAEGNTILLSRGSGNVAIMVDEGTDERAALAKLRDEWLAMGTVTAGDIVAVADVRPDHPASRFAYSGTFPGEALGGPVEGEVTGVRGSEIVVVFDAWAGFGEFVTLKDDVAAIILETTIP